MFDLDAIFNQLSNNLIRDAVITILFFLTLLGLRAGIRRAILSRESLDSAYKLRLLATVRNLALLIFLMGIPLIWGNEIQNFAVSMVAMAAACVLATKEAILCILGAIYRTSGNLYKIGDRIEITGIRGQIIDMSLLSTTLIESSQACANGTVGRCITIPNSLLFNQALYNETVLGGRFATQIVHISIERDDD